ncbi:MAG: TetR/AcrR family transcriptional regulator [Deltaproteobacteria bacterium]|nr:TetR/AcrR family transcriptional regulator [Deltaproteobacteria bacterium]
MGRSENTYEKIIAAAVELFARKGYHGTSIRDITDKVGVSKGAMHNHFTSKGELVQKLIREYEARYVNEIIRISEEQPGTARDKLHRAMSIVSEFALQNVEWNLFFDNLSNELKSDPDFAPLFAAVRFKLHKFRSDLISQGIRQGLLKKELNPNLASFLMESLSIGMFQVWVMNRTLIDGKEFVRMMRTVLFKGIDL